MLNTFKIISIISFSTVLLSCNESNLAGGGKSNVNPPANVIPGTNGVPDQSTISALPPGTGTTAGGDLTEILQQCGVTLSGDQNKIIYNREFAAINPIVKQGAKDVILTSIPYQIRIVPKLKIYATLNKSTVEKDFFVAANFGAALGEALKEINPKKGKTITETLDIASRSQLMTSSPDWNGIICGVQPVKKIITETPNGRIVVEFNPPIPTSINPKAIAARYDQELGDYKAFNNVSATVVESTIPAIPVGRSITGNVQVKRINPQENMGRFPLNASRAYRIITQFGSPAETEQLGLKQGVDYLIDEAARDFSAIVVDTNEPESRFIAFQ